MEFTYRFQFNASLVSVSHAEGQNKKKGSRV